MSVLWYGLKGISCYESDVMFDGRKTLESLLP